MTDKNVKEYEPDVLRVLQSKDQTKAFYNKIARVYDVLAERSEQPMRDAGLAMLGARPGEMILEIGFGTGHCVAALATAVGNSGRIYGVDISERMCELADHLVAEQGLADRVELLCNDAEHLPYEDQFLDGVFMSFTLELFDTPNIPRVLAECRRVLKSNGRLVVVAVSKEGQSGLLVKSFEWTHRHFPNLMDCRPIYVRRALQAAGFEIREAEIAQMWVPVEIVLGIKKNNEEVQI